MDLQESLGHIRDIHHEQLAFTLDSLADRPEASLDDFLVEWDKAEKKQTAEALEIIRKLCY